MSKVQKDLSRSFVEFFDAERSSGLLLIVCTLVSLALANSAWGAGYLRFWHLDLGGMSVEHWVNDALMALFFLLIGLELEREVYNGELSNFRNALLPTFAALGGLAVPAAIHYFLNAGTPTQAGMGIPMATDIAFALGVLALLGDRVPSSLKVFVVALAVIDDLCAIIIIAAFYTAKLSTAYLIGALIVWALLVACNRLLRVMSIVPYMIGGVLMWYLMFMSGVHATIAGVLLAFAIPFSPKEDDAASPSHRLEHLLHKPVAFVVLPVFALANTGIVIGPGWTETLLSANSSGIIGGLVFGKPLGITLMSFAAVTAGVCRLPADLRWRQILGAGLLGGIGFTISIFITNLAFAGDPTTINASKMAILLASLTAGTAGFIWLRLWGRSGAGDPLPVG